MEKSSRARVNFLTNSGDENAEDRVSPEGKGRDERKWTMSDEQLGDPVTGRRRLIHRQRGGQ